MKILFIHQNFPAQYRHLAAALHARGDEVTALTTTTAPGMSGIRVLRYPIARGNTPSIHPWLTDTESKVVRGEACHTAAKKLAVNGYRPDIICAHPGWGEALFIKDLWPEVPLLSYFEYYYNAEGQDVGFDPEFPAVGDIAPRLRMKNLCNLMALETCDAGIAPTEWQRNTHPLHYRARIRVIHDGIDTARIVPNPQIELQLGNDTAPLHPGDEIVTYFARCLEPLRGYHIFMRALPEILRRRPQARVIIAGSPGTAYGALPEDGLPFARRYWNEVKDALPQERVHFVGTVPHDTLIGLMQISAAHVYLSYPFILSWSLLETMSAGGLVIAARTVPVEEVIENGENGLLVDFFSPSGIADAVCAALAEPAQFRRLRERARQRIVEHYDLTTRCLPAQLAYLDEIRARGV